LPAVQLELLGDVLLGVFEDPPRNVRLSRVEGESHDLDVGLSQCGAMTAVSCSSLSLRVSFRASLCDQNAHASIIQDRPLSLPTEASERPALHDRRAESDRSVRREGMRKAASYGEMSRRGGDVSAVPRCAEVEAASADNYSDITPFSARPRPVNPRGHAGG
jgi:hypothetical protein